MGGAQQLALNMASTLKNQQIQFGQKVIGINTVPKNAAQVLLEGQDQYQGSYAGIFNSTTLGAMQQMDLTNAGLNYGQKQAIRSLGYGASSKVGMKFTIPWWRTLFGINQGGLGHSDLPTRTTVYPSYNIYDPTSSTAVLLCSYEWSQDAQRMATLISSSSDHATAVAEEADLKELVLRDLALLHANHPNKPMSAEEVYNTIAPLYIDHYAHDWYHDENTFGAFAFFRPMQFAYMWPYITQSTSSLAIIGEHASPHHAWVVGALESAVSGVYQWLKMNGYTDAVTAMDSWGNTPTPSNPFAGIPFWTTADQRDWQAFFGLLHEENFVKQHARKHKK